MFKQVIVHYPKEESTLNQINKDLIDFRCNAAVKYINTLKLNDRQMETLFDSLATDIFLKQQTSNLNT